MSKNGVVRLGAGDGHNVSRSVDGVSSCLPSLVAVSTGVNERNELVNVEPWNVSVGVFGYTSVPDEVVKPRFENVPKRDSATAMAHRSVAQNGQYSAPM